MSVFDWEQRLSKNVWLLYEQRACRGEVCDHANHISWVRQCYIVHPKV